MTPADVPQAFALYSTYMRKFQLRQVFDEAEFGYWLLPRPNVINSYVVPVGQKTHVQVTLLSWHPGARGAPYPSPTKFFCRVLQGPDGTITDFFSYYHLPSTVIGHPKHKVRGGPGE